jgi:uncharacterized membrane protein YgcG
MWKGVPNWPLFNGCPLPRVPFSDSGSDDGAWWEPLLGPRCKARASASSSIARKPWYYGGSIKPTVESANLHAVSLPFCRGCLFFGSFTYQYSWSGPKPYPNWEPHDERVPSDHWRGPDGKGHFSPPLYYRHRTPIYGDDWWERIVDWRWTTGQDVMADVDSSGAVPKVSFFAVLPCGQERNIEFVAAHRTDFTWPIVRWFTLGFFPLRSWENVEHGAYDGVMTVSLNLSCRECPSVAKPKNPITPGGGSTPPGGGGGGGPGSPTPGPKGGGGPSTGGGGDSLPPGGGGGRSGPRVTPGGGWYKTGGERISGDLNCTNLASTASLMRAVMS